MPSAGTKVNYDDVSLAGWQAGSFVQHTATIENPIKLYCSLVGRVQ